jgi:hypothetical protein
LRLKAIGDAPDAFFHPPGVEAGLPPELWEEWAAGADRVMFVAERDGAWLAMPAVRCGRTAAAPVGRFPRRRCGVAGVAPPRLSVAALLGAAPTALAAVAVARYGPETRRRPLEEVSRDLGNSGVDIGA